jgi:hypothetical protein
MSSSLEASDRITFKELSQFECTHSTNKHAHPRDRKPDPFKCVKKYRRSTAGCGVENETLNGSSSRSLLVLRGKIFARQQNDGMEEQFSSAETVNFVDDRPRAVQVDLTTLLERMNANDHSGEVWTTV